ncbi:hypothetical protein QTP88_011916 [Uroleucon formosanum]
MGHGEAKTLRCSPIEWLVQLWWWRKKTCSMLVRAKFRYFSSSCLPRFGVRTAACGLTDTDEKIRGKNTRESKGGCGGKGRGSDTLLLRRMLADGNLIQNLLLLVEDNRSLLLVFNSLTECLALGSRLVYSYNLLTETIETIDHKFMVPGHSRIECVSDHAKIEKARKTFPSSINHPYDWMQLIRFAGKK